MLGGGHRKRRKSFRPNTRTKVLESKYEFLGAALRKSASSTVALRGCQIDLQSLLLPAEMNVENRYFSPSLPTTTRVSVTVVLLGLQYLRKENHHMGWVVVLCPLHFMIRLGRSGNSAILFFRLLIIVVIIPSRCGSLDVDMTHEENDIPAVGGVNRVTKLNWVWVG